MRFLIFFVGMVIIFSSQGVYAKSYDSRGYPGENIKLKYEFAKNAKPIWHTVVESSKTLSDIVIDECGNQPEEFYTYLIKEASTLNAIQNISKKIALGKTVAIPFCHKLIRNPLITIRSGDSLSKIARLNTGFEGDKTLSRIVELNTGLKKPTKEQINTFSRQLTPGKKLHLPYRTVNKTIKWTNDNTLPSRYINLFPPSQMRVELALATIQPQLNPRDDQYILESVGTRDVHSQSTCSYGCHVAADAKAPFDLSAFQNRFTIEKKISDEFFGSSEPSIVGIIDTGLKGFGNGIFKEKYFSKNLAEIERDQVRDPVDKDRNGHKNDVWGTRFPEKDGVIESFGGKDVLHGTNMSALILGGVDFLSSDAYEPFIKLRVVNFLNQKGTGLTDSWLFPKAVNYLKEKTKDKSNIINVSLKTTKDFESISEAIFNNQNVLFVAAASQEKSGKGKDLSQKITSVYPASLGGKHLFSGNIITVAALGHHGIHLESSNWGESVDIHAPGFNILTTNGDGKTIGKSGTSISAAIVSFAAGAIRSLGRDRMPAKSIKMRLIASADIDPKLKTKSWTKAKLNVIKAISLNHDVIEVKKSNEYLFTKIKNVENLVTFCGEEDLRAELEGVLKIRPNIHTGEPALKIDFWVERENGISKIQCKQINSDKSIGVLVAEDGSETEGQPISEIKDIVVAPFRK